MEKRQPFISVIMPVYKVENYVGRAVESIQNQTFSDWELWLVDDGSPDKSGAICDGYAAKDERIHVIHKENGGAPGARNTAMEKAAGKYFYFMDSDDWAEPEMLADMAAEAEKNRAQLVITAFYIDTYYSECDRYSQIRRQPGQIFENQREFRENAYRLIDWNLIYTPWNKLYLAEYLKENNLRFPNVHWDDFPFNLSVIRDVEKVCVMDRPYYHFIRKRKESESEKYNPRLYEKREEEHRWLKELYRYWGISDAPSLEMVSRRYAERLVGCVENLTNPSCGMDKKQKKERIRAMITTPQCREALQYARPRSAMMKAMLLPIKWKLAELVYLEGCVISKVKTTDTKIFAKLKADR